MFVWFPVYIFGVMLIFICCMMCCIGLLAASGTEIEALNNTETGRAINKAVREARGNQTASNDIEFGSGSSCPVCTNDFADGDSVA